MEGSISTTAANEVKVEPAHVIASSVTAETITSDIQLPIKKKNPLQWVDSSIIFLSILVSFVIYFIGSMYTAPLMLLGLLILDMIKWRMNVLKLVNMAVFLPLSLLAAHQFDLSKTKEVIIANVLPILAFTALLMVLKRMKFKWTWMDDRLRKLVAKTKLHWSILALLSGYLVAVIVKDRLSIYGGTGALVLLTYLIFQGRVSRKIFIASSLALLSYLLMIHIMLWHAVEMITTVGLDGWIGFIPTIATPLLIHKIHLKARRSDKTPKIIR